jgi:CheY-like chemotaxis protein
MVRAVVVNQNARLAARHAAVLREAGYVVELCGGPSQDPCPLAGNLPCPLVDRADVLIYDAWIAGTADDSRLLITELRETYPDLPIVLTSANGRVDWIELEGPHRVTPVVANPTPEVLRAAVEVALADQGMAV